MQVVPFVLHVGLDAGVALLAFRIFRGGSGGRNSISCVADTVSPLPCYQEPRESGFLYVQVRT